MRIISFDIFDTLLTRLVAYPADLFLLLAEDLRKARVSDINGAELAARRIAAETKARGAADYGETNFDEIYAELGASLSWNQAQIEVAKQIELSTERKWIRVATVARSHLEKARVAADQIIFLSDMYLPFAFVKSILIEGELWREGDLLFVSSESKRSKASGSLFLFVREKLGTVASWRHFGDNVRADVRMPARYGIDGQALTHCSLTRYESIFRPSAARALPLWRTKVAGAIRYARLGFTGTDPHQQQVWNLGVSVAGPILFGFVAWLLEVAVKQGVRRLYFISRDGEILLKIAQELIVKWSYPLEARYLYLSRQVWRPAHADTLDDWYKDWVLAKHTPTDLKAIFVRLGLDPAQFRHELALAGFPESHWHKLLTEPQREPLWSAICNGRMAEAAIQKRRDKRAITQRYLVQEGLAEDLPMGLVDLGWFGSMQHCVATILKDVPVRQSRPLIGFYFGLVNPKMEEPHWVYWQDRAGLRPLHRTNFTLFERLAIGTHGSVRGHHEREGRIIPDLEKNRQAVTDWGADFLHESIMSLSSNLTEVLVRGEIDPSDFFSLSRNCFQLFTEAPTRHEALAFGRMPLLDQENETRASTVAPIMSEKEIFLALLDRRRTPGLWLEGTSKLTGSPLLLIYLAARVARFRINRFRAALVNSRAKGTTVLRIT
jgi:hypothetical protein